MWLIISDTCFTFSITAITKCNRMTDKNDFDVIIIGGSYAGLSAAMALGRSLRNVLIIDGGHPCNIQTPHSHNFLTQDGKTPQEISALARGQVESYETVKFYEGLAVSGIKTANGFEISTDAEYQFTASKLIIAAGIKDIMPDINGFANCWGISIIHCPYCHGYEYRDQNTGIIANGQKAFHLASMVYNLTKKVTVLTNGKADFTSEQVEKLKYRNIKIVETKISEIKHRKGQLSNLIFEDGNRIPFDVAYGAIPFIQHSDIPVSLGCELTEHGYIKVDAFQKTTIEGVFACGDNSSMMRALTNAVYTGGIAGAMVNGALVQEQF